jgi:hypothetical protein
MIKLSESPLRVNGFPLREDHWCVADQTMRVRRDERNRAVAEPNMHELGEPKEDRQGQPSMMLKEPGRLTFSRSRTEGMSCVVLEAESTSLIQMGLILRQYSGAKAPTSLRSPEANGSP